MSGSPYEAWFLNCTNRFQAAFDAIEANHNFELGDEFEIALCNVLRAILPRRVGVCRGYVVGMDGSMAGDDIVLFDIAAFPTLRFLGDDLTRKEQVPAEAVLAYIEAKHTLHTRGNGGQSLVKAFEQIARVKSIPRERIPHNEVAPGVRLNAPFVVTSPPGYPDYQNPYYCAIMARHLNTDGAPDSRNELLQRILEVCQIPNHALAPDMIAAGELFASPMLPADKIVETRPFLCPQTTLATVRHQERAFGFAAAHMLWAIGKIRLGDMPWPRMLTAAFNETNDLLFVDPITPYKDEPEPEPSPEGSPPASQAGGGSGARE